MALTINFLRIQRTLALTLDHRFMNTPAANMVEIVNLSPSDALLPIMECVSNSVISLSQSGLPLKDRKIDVEIIRGVSQQSKLFDDIKPIKNVVITDNGIGFNDKNLESFETPHSNILRKQYGCLGVGRFTVLAAFRKMKIRSNFRVNGHWKYRELNFDALKEVEIVADNDSENELNQTVVEMRDCFNDSILDKTAVSIEVIAREIMEHFLVFHLCDDLPNITVLEGGEEPQNVNDLYEGLMKGNEVNFKVESQKFKGIITRNRKITSRKNHYIHYCADSRVVGRARPLGSLDSIFNYPLWHQSEECFLDVFVVSPFLNEKKNSTRTRFLIPNSKEDRLYDDEITLQDIGQQLAKVLRKEYSEQVKQMQEADMQDWRSYMTQHPRYNSLSKDEEFLRGLPAKTTEEKKEEILHRTIYRKEKEIDGVLQDFIKTKLVNEENIQEITKEIQEKAILDKDSLADYMVRRKAVIDLFDRFLEADKKGDYKLEKDIHKLIFPMGTLSEEINYEAHNLWLLDERLVSYQFIASDKEIRTYCDVDSQKAADLVLFNNPIGFGDTNHGDISSLIIFEFKRPGEVAGNMPKNNRWEFSELTDKYFEDFRFGKRKKIKNKGRAVNVSQTTPKFGYIVLSEIPQDLADYNVEMKGWKKTPFSSFYKIEPGSNMHIEVMTFDNLIKAAKQRHNPFFDRLFVKASSKL